MEDLQDKIIELMDLFDGEVTTADKIDRPQRALDKQAIDDFMDRNPMAAGGMLAQPSADGSRQEYATSTVKTKKFKYPKNYYNQKTKKVETVYMDKPPKSSAKEIGSGKFSMAERNRVTRIKYPEYSSYSKLLKKEPAKAKTVMANLQYASVAGSKIKKKNVFTPLTIIQQNKILAEFPDADFSKGKFGFNQANEQTKFAQVKRFINRGYKPRFKKIPLNLQEEIKQKFSYFKDWDFDNYKYGVPGSGGGSKTGRVNRENNILAQRVKLYISEPKPFKLAFSMDRPGSWMLQQMYRAWEHGNTDYKPIYNKNDKVIGMKENGKAYYANENVAPSNKVKLINSHPEFNKVQKFVDVANEAKLPLKDLGGYKNTKSLLALFPEGYESIKFNDLVSYLYKEQGVDVTRNAIEKHHLKSLSDMGAPVDSKNLQLLRKDLNTLGNTITQQIKKGDLSRVTDLEKAGVKITVDGKTYGKGFQDPRKQFNRIIGDVTQKISSLDETQLNKLILNFAATITDQCAVNLPSKKDGGRIGFKLGSDDCFKIGKEALDNGLTKGFKNKQQVNLAETILKAGGGLKSAFALRNIFGPAAIAATVAFEGGLIGYDMLTSGKTLREAFGDNLLNYALGKDYQIDPQEELFKRFKGLGYNNQQIGSIKKSLDAMNTINTGAQLAMDVGQQQEALEKSRGQTEEFMIPDDQMMADTAGQRAEQNLKDARERLTAFNQSLEAVDRPGGMKKEDVLSEYFSSGKYAEGLDLFEQAQKEADIQKLESAGPKFMGSIFPQFEKGRQEDLADLRSVINPAFNIPGARDATFIPGKTTGGLFGLAEGGRAGYRLGKIVKPKPSKARTDVKSIIDENIKLMKQMKETGEIDEISSDLNQVIKKALDEDLLDKKDRIVDSINISEAKKRRNYPYNMQVQEEPKNLDFYTAIQESNFRTKTGPYFDRIRRLKRAGGGLLKQAGDRSGPPPESGPMSQGLPSLMKRGMKI